MSIGDQTGKALVEAAAGALGTIFGPAAHELGGLLGDQMRFWRFQNVVRILERVKSICQKKGISDEELQALGFGEQYRLIDKASFEEIPEIQDLWAGLIFNSIKPNASVSPERRILQVLESIGPAEAGFLRVMVYAVGINQRIFEQSGVDLFKQHVQEVAEKHWRHFDENVQSAALQNLIRLRCIALRPQLRVEGLLAKPPRELLGAHYQSGFDNWTLVEERKFTQLLRDIIGLMEQNSGLVPPIVPTKDRTADNSIFGMENTPLVREFAFGLTALGEEVVTACETEVNFEKFPGER